ncbi:DDHD domain protein [Aspergillus bombycis]|uniref:DDHD domain protein n=1 Tax=Aspergillus bombycis TaxID=109264 RepID=A0A1F7ZQ99_9EURO|nr:DDHD domain protein [Aspergillus bombycis]OGM41634.1 DDHD domain protein [Aspergillus bombycis]
MFIPAQALTYEDVAKLSPFYEEYRSFWDMSPNMDDITSPLDTSTNSSRSIGLRSESDQSLYSPEISSLPPVRDVQPFSVGGSAAERLLVAVHDGHEYTPTYNTIPEAIASQAAVLEYDNPCKQPLPPVQEPIDICERESFGLDHIDSLLGQTRSSHKKLFGRNGWLGGTADLGYLSSEKHKSKSLKDLRKKIVDGFTEGMAKASLTIIHEPRGMEDHLPQSTTPISLNPPIQAMLYSELEVMVCVSANAFLVQQYHEGRLSGESIKRIKDYWGSKNRPSVVEFQFDQATQQRLISANKRSLRFNGESSTNPVLLSSNLHNWKAIVKEMSIRTFCAPDSVIRKHMHDVYQLLDMLGAPVATLAVCQKLHIRALSLMGN